MTGSATPDEPQPPARRILEQALAHRDLGFGVFSVWSTHDGKCRCPKGADCDSPGKHPIPPKGFRAASWDPEQIKTMLSAPSLPNYGIVWPDESPDVIFVLDVDGPDWQARVKHLVSELGELPGTKITITPSGGRHVFFRWPKMIPLPAKLGHMFGFVTRWPMQGYVVGPGSSDGRGTWTQRNDLPIATLPKEWALEATRQAKPELSIVPTAGGPADPSTIHEGGRHDYLRDRARTLRGGGLTGQALFDAVWSINLRFPEPKDEDSVRRAIGDVETKFAEDPPPGVRAKAEPVPVTTDPHELFAPIDEYRADVPTVIPWIAEGLVYLGGVTLVSGPPKLGKSTLLANLLRSREHPEPFLGLTIPAGPTLLVTEEGGLPVVRKTEGLHQLMVLDRRAAVEASLGWKSLLGVIATWAEANPEALVVIDTLAIWAGITQENDASEVTAALGDLAVLAQQANVGLVAVHHARKGGGAHGEAIRGSTAFLATVDVAVEMDRARNDEAEGSDERELSVMGRVVMPAVYRLNFDRDTLTYEMSDRRAGVDLEVLLEKVPGPTEVGLTAGELRGLWGKDPRKNIELLTKAGLLSRDWHRDGKASGWRYRRTPPLIAFPGSGVSKSAEMAAIFAGVEVRATVEGPAADEPSGVAIDASPDDEPADG